MKNLFYILLIICLTGCQSTKIKNKKYKISAATIELGGIGTASSINILKNDFSTYSFPELQNNIRLDVQVVPFTKSINYIYIDKVKDNQLQNNIIYADSLPQKPKFATFTLMDYAGVINELNADQNKNILTYLKDRGNASMITSIAVILPDEIISKLQQSDTFYLINDQTKKYTIALYKDGKKFDIIDLQSGTSIAYTLGKFCWSMDDRQQWYISDIINGNKSCKNSTHNKIKKRKEKNLFKL